MTILERKKQIKNLVATGNVHEAIKRSMDFVEDFGQSNNLTNEIVLISSNFFEVQRLKNTDTTDFEALSRQQNKILLQMLTLLDEVETLFAKTSAA
jgi:hypothetical protein